MDRQSGGRRSVGIEETGTEELATVSGAQPSKANRPGLPQARPAVRLLFSSVI